MTNQSKNKEFDEYKPLKIVKNIIKKSKFIKYLIVAVGIVFILYFGLTLIFIISPGIIFALGMGLANLPDTIKLPNLPYNSIDFQKIAYIDNQFMMYGIDHQHYATTKSLVIFNSVDGKRWDKSTIKINDDNQNQPISVVGTFSYLRNTK